MATMALDFGDPVPVDALPEATTRGGRQSTAPAIQAWLNKLQPGKFYQLQSKDEDGAHGANRVQQVRKVAGEAFEIQTRPLVPGKRYFIYAKIAGT